MARLQPTAAKMVQIVASARKGPSNKNVQSSARRQGAQVPGQVSTAPLKGPDKGTG